MIMALIGVHRVSTYRRAGQCSSGEQPLAPTTRGKGKSGKSRQGFAAGKGSRRRAKWWATRARRQETHHKWWATRQVALNSIVNLFATWFFRRRRYLRGIGERSPGRRDWCRFLISAASIAMRLLQPLPRESAHSWDCRRRPAMVGAGRQAHSWRNRSTPWRA